MLTNASENEARERLEALRQTPFFAAVLKRAEASPVPLRLVLEASHLELGGVTPVAERPNRALLKVFRQGANRHAAFFYKRSNVPASQDRFAYGVVLVDGAFREGDAEAWFRWVDTGFKPEFPPPGLKRVFAFTVPD